jgi:hypothetical protein
MGPLAFMIANLLGASDLKGMLLHRGEEVARKELENLWRARVEPHIPQIAADMERDGFSWEGHGGRSTADEGLGRGFVLSRDALYRLIKTTGVIGGWARDGWRDGADNAVWATIKDRVSDRMSLADFTGPAAEGEEPETLPGLVRLTFEGWIEHTL